MRKQFLQLSIVVLLGACLPGAALAQGVATEIAPADLSAAVAQCSTSSGCTAAMNALVARYAALNPAVPVGTIIASVATELVAAYNSGGVSSALAQVSLNTLASIPGSSPSLNAAIQTAIASMAAGEPVPVTAIASIVPASAT